MHGTRLMGWGERRRANRKIAKDAVGKERAQRSREANRNVIVGVIAAVLAIGIMFFFVVSPTFVAKPGVPRPALASPSEISSEHVNWLLNEVGAYRLHPYFLFGELPVIESVITDQNRRFTTTVKDNYPTTVEGTASSPDMRFLMTSSNFAALYGASDVLAKAREMRMSGQITAEILKDEFTMAVKGYKSIYDSLPA